MTKDEFFDSDLWWIIETFFIGLGIVLLFAVFEFATPYIVLGGIWILENCMWVFYFIGGFLASFAIGLLVRLFHLFSHHF